MSISTLSALLLISIPFSAERTVTISELLLGLLPDEAASGGTIPWTKSNALAVTWESGQPVAADDWLKREGFTLRRTGAARVSLGTEPPLDATILLQGNSAGFQQALVFWDVLSGPFDGVVRALRSDGVELKPFKCDREKEGASYGNVVWLLSARGKRVTALGENWDCAQNGCHFTLTLFKSTKSAEAIECYSGG